MIDVSLIGTSGMLPLPNRWLSAMMIRHKGSSILFDCGEGTQISLKQLGWSIKAIDCICFTHFHADHISGLPGLLLSMGNSDRKEPVLLVGPEGLENTVKGLLVIAPELPFEVNYHEFNYGDITNLKVGDIHINTFPVEHGLPCVGYVMNLYRQPKFMPNKAKELNIPVQYWGDLQRGKSIELEGNLYTADMVLGEQRKGIRVSFCTDTKPINSIVEHIKDSDLLICEGMYGEVTDNNSDKYHMNIYDAASMAKDSNAKELWLTHYSPSFTNQEDYTEDVKEIFDNTHFGYDRMTKELRYE